MIRSKARLKGKKSKVGEAITARHRVGCCKYAPKKVEWQAVPLKGLSERKSDERREAGGQQGQ